MSDKSSKVLCIIGSGVQARSHARVLIHARNFQEVWQPQCSTIFLNSLQIRVWGRSLDNLKKCVDEITAIVGGGARVTAYQDVSEAVSGADVIVTVSFASEPILHGEWIKPGALVCGQICADRIGWKFCF